MQSNAIDVVFIFSIFFVYFYFSIHISVHTVPQLFFALVNFLWWFFLQHQGDFSHTFNTTNTRCYFNIVYIRFSLSIRF